MKSSASDIWKKLNLPALSEDETQQAMQQWRVEQFRTGTPLSSKEEAQLTIDSIFNDSIQEQLNHALPQTTVSTKFIALQNRNWWVSAVAALLLLAFGLSWTMDDSQAYPAMIAKAQQLTSPNVEQYLGATYQIQNNLCDLKQTAPALANHKNGIAIPEGVATVLLVGHTQGVAFFDIQQGDCQMRVLTVGTLPAIGEIISFNAQVIKTSHFGREIALLVETVRHEVF